MFHVCSSAHLPSPIFYTCVSLIFFFNVIFLRNGRAFVCKSSSMILILLRSRMVGSCTVISAISHNVLVVWDAWGDFQVYRFKESLGYCISAYLVFSSPLRAHGTAGSLMHYPENSNTLQIEFLDPCFGFLRKFLRTTF